MRILPPLPRTSSSPRAAWTSSQRQVDQLLAAQSAAVQQLEHEAVTQRERLGTTDGVADRVDLRRSQGMRQPTAAARSREVLRRIGGQHAAFGEEAAERAHGRELAGQRRRRVAAPAQVGGEGPYAAAVEPGEGQAAGVGPLA